MGGPETCTATWCDGRSVFVRIVKLVVEAGKPVVHHWFAVNSPTAVNQQQVLKEPPSSHHN